MMRLVPIPSIKSDKYLTGQTPKVGDVVWVKIDHETQGKVTKVDHNEVEVSVWSELLGKHVTAEVFASDCWLGGE